MEIFALVIGCFAIGFIVRKVEPRAIQLTGPINKSIIYFIFPAIVLSTAPDIEFSSSSLFVALTPWVFGCLVLLPICILVSRKLNLSLQEEAAVILLSILGNTAFLGIGMVRSLLGEESIPSAVLYDQLGSFAILATLGTIVIAIYSNSNTTDNKFPAISTIIKKVVSFPPFIALIISLLIPSSSSLGPLLTIFKWIGSAIIPLAFIVVGLQIELKVKAKHYRPIAFALCLKMLLLPVLTMASGLIFSVSNPQFNTAVFQAAMPPMVTPAIMLIEAKIAPKLTASILGIGTVAGFITLPLWAYVLKVMI